ncbi:acetate/propionate family kinase [Novosphingobium mangrovi (ex Huang et al. 2023)]|uniref:Acetate kinase n=2 Tax=Novosphingobium TaxID=165696 RepID=A0ABT2IBP6_9SPHN|nr:acetate/propionate family kinase [Novosphingobium mangrovi (ex Huang et al. 2023)]MCT2401998.1 acetate/propionate family kinase [Novosphingobium mangrovi (ex Huang et al. 2023)]
MPSNGRPPQPQLRAAAGDAILVINSGSSSVKFALFSTKDPPARLWSGAIDRIGLAHGRFHAVDAAGTTAFDETAEVADHDMALHLLLDAIDRHTAGDGLAAVGHRIVHGGAECDCATFVTETLEARLREFVPLAPLHQPHNLAGITAVRNARPDLSQIACFDTAFHHGMPHLATLTGLPRELRDQGIRRYGFHGLSYEYVVERLRSEEVDVDGERVIVAHLGNGASMCALKGGRSVETTMGFSTLSGLPMGTRCGDLDPGIILYLLTEMDLSADRLRHLLYEESGLLGLSGFSRNMQELLARPTDHSALEAVAYFCYQARSHLAALTAVLGGLDRLVFTGGIGANAPMVRADICADLGYLGVALDPTRNTAGARVISSAAGRVVVEAFATDEEQMIAQHMRRLLAAQPARQVA